METEKKQPVNDGTEVEGIASEQTVRWRRNRAALLLKGFTATSFAKAIGRSEPQVRRVLKEGCASPYVLGKFRNLTGMDAIR